MADSCSSEIDYKIISFILGASTAFMLLLVMIMSMYIKRVLKLKEATPLDNSFVFKPRVTARRNGAEGSFSVNTHNPMYDPQTATAESRAFEARSHSFEARPTIRARNTDDPPFSDIGSVVGGRALSVVHSESSHITNGLGRHLSGFDRDIAQLDNSDSGSNATHARGTSAQIKQQRAAANAKKRLSSLDRSMRDSSSLFDMESAHNKSTEDIESLDFGWPDVESDSDSPQKVDLERQRRSIHAEAEKREREEAELAVVDEATTLPGMSFHDSRAHAADDNEI